MSSSVATPPGTQPQFNPFAHTQDHDSFEFFESLNPNSVLHKIDLPAIHAFGMTLQITKFMVLLAVAAVLVMMMLFYLASRIRSGDPSKGVLQNILESLVYFVRDGIARPAIGNHDDADKFLPYLATTFLFVFIANLMGMIPFLGSPTASIAVTAALALVSFVITHSAGIREYGVFGYLKTFVPHIELEGPTKLMGIFLVPLIMILELMTPFIRVFVLSVRLFANMLAGHTALYMLLYFIKMVSATEWLSFNQADTALYWVVMPFSILLVTALSLLELMVAALQAFIFTLLTAIFIGLAKHPAH